MGVPTIEKISQVNGSIVGTPGQEVRTCMRSQQVEEKGDDDT